MASQKTMKILESVLRSDMERIQMTLTNIDKNAFESAVNTLSKAKRVYVIGIRNCAPLAGFLSSSLNLILNHVVLVQATGASDIFEQMIHVGERDVVIGISFPRYSMRTLKALEFANSRKAKVITLTDDIHSPINLYSSCNLIAKSDMTSMIDSLVAPLSVINALIVALSVKKEKNVIHTIETLETIRDEYQVYSGDDLNMVEDQETFHLE